MEAVLLNASGGDKEDKSLKDMKENLFDRRNILNQTPLVENPVYLPLDLSNVTHSGTSYNHRIKKLNLTIDGVQKNLPHFCTNHLDPTSPKGRERYALYNVSMQILYWELQLPDKVLTNVGLIHPNILAKSNMVKNLDQQHKSSNLRLMKVQTHYNLPVDILLGYVTITYYVDSSDLANHHGLLELIGLIPAWKRGAARTQAPTTTNYDVGSATWADLRKAPLQSAMEVTSLGHRPS
ncbi:hypothetical protein JHK86_015862 [Glycine max]|nr:hypothetical protein JHK86_015862 [Glycine max]